MTFTLSNFCGKHAVVTKIIIYIYISYLQTQPILLASSVNALCFDPADHHQALNINDFSSWCSPRVRNM